MLKNQIKVLLQRVHTGGRKPKAILVSKPLLEALRAEMQGSISVPYVRNTFPKDDLFAGVPVRVVKGVTTALIELEPETDTRKSSGLIIP